MAGLRLENISKVFDKKITAVDNFNLEVQNDEIMVLAGPSGCGKTTTLRIIAGLEKPGSGNVYIDQTLVNNTPPRDRNVAMVFQNFALYPHFNVFENIAFPLKMRKVSKNQISQQVTQTARLLGIEELLSRRPHTLSGGQRQRVAVARAFVRSPKVFLYDEPLSNLDAQMRLAMRSELKALHKRLNTAVLYVTHDQNEAFVVGDRIAVMKDGRIHQVDTPQQIYEMPQDKFVAGFFGTPPMNFFQGRLSIKDDKPLLNLAGFEIALPPKLKTITAGNFNKTIIAGIRPEDIYPQTGLASSENCITATVEFVEYQASRCSVYLSLNSGDKFVVSTENAQNFQTGYTIKVRFNPDKILLFEDSPAGKNLQMLTK